MVFSGPCFEGKSNFLTLSLALLRDILYEIFFGHSEFVGQQCTGYLILHAFYMRSKHLTSICRLSNLNPEFFHICTWKVGCNLNEHK